jgi:hypothetical protein
LRGRVVAPACAGDKSAVTALGMVLLAATPLFGAGFARSWSQIRPQPGLRARASPRRPCRRTARRHGGARDFSLRRFAWAAIPTIGMAQGPRKPECRLRHHPRRHARRFYGGRRCRHIKAPIQLWRGDRILPLPHPSMRRTGCRRNLNMCRTPVISRSGRRRPQGCGMPATSFLSAARIML